MPVSRKGWVQPLRSRTSFTACAAQEGSQSAVALGVGLGSLALRGWLLVPPPSVHARYGHTLRFYIMPYFAKWPPVSRKLLWWQPPLRALRVYKNDVMQSALRWAAGASAIGTPYAPPPAALWVCWHLGISQALRAAF